MKAKMFRALLPIAILMFVTSCSTEDTTDVINVEVKRYAFNPTEVDLMKLINDHRESIGLNVLEPIEHISFKSAEHNEFMIENNVVGHQYFENRSSNIRQVLGAVKVSENIAYNYNSNAGVMNAWLNSEGHKDNIEGDYTHFGLSIAINPETGRKYYTNIFMKR